MVLDIVGTNVRVRATDASISSFELRIGSELPPSLKTFLTEYGYGRFGNLFLFYVPNMSHCDGLEARCEAMREELDCALVEDIGELEPDGSADLYRRAVPFARSENGGFLMFDPEGGVGPERAIYYVAPRMVGCFAAGASIDDLLRRLTSPEVRTILGPGYQPLPRTFEPLKVRVSKEPDSP